MDLRHQLLACLAVTWTAASASQALAAAPAAALGQTPVERMIDLNRRAFADLQQQHFQAAKYWLTEALVIAETAGLERDEMTARTYVHLAVVYLAGMQNRAEAIRQFRLALRINPNITITAGLESPALKSAYLQAREEMELPPNPDPTAEAAVGSTSPPGLPPRTGPSPGLGSEPVRLSSELEPDPPARVAVPLLCSVPVEARAERDFVVRCLTQKQQKRASATLYYRSVNGSGKYEALPMGHSSKGWLVATIPGTAISGRSLSYYVKAQLPGASTSVYHGYPEAPKALTVTAAATDVAEGAPPGSSSSGSDHEDSWHRRNAGAAWLSLGAGLGTAYHGREPIDSRSGPPSSPLYVEPGFSPATLFQLEPELGYQLTPSFALSLLGRYQYAPLDGSFSPRPDQRAVPTYAVAGFARAHLLLGSIGNLQTYASGGAGFGNSFLAVIHKRCDRQPCSLTHSDTLHGGSVALTAGLGLVYRFSSSFGLLVDVKEIMTLPKVMALTEFNLGLELAHDFRGQPARRAAVRDMVAAQ